MHAADRDDFPFVDEICQGIFHYLENKCPLRMMPLPALYDKMRRMLEQIGCETIATQLKPLAPPVHVCLLRLIQEHDCSFEMALYPLLRKEIDELYAAGANEIRFLHIKECAMHIRGVEKWDKASQALYQEINTFLKSYDPLALSTQSSTLIVHLCETGV